MRLFGVGAPRTPHPLGAHPQAAPRAGWGGSIDGNGVRSWKWDLERKTRYRALFEKSPRPADHRDEVELSIKRLVGPLIRDANSLMTSMPRLLDCPFNEHFTDSRKQVISAP
jgi:hypothetical protein